MDDLSEVLVEVHRLQMLAFIGRSARGAPCTTPCDVAEWLRIPLSECSLLVAELTDEGFVDWGSSRSGSFLAPLRLTASGLGVLEWNRRRTARLSELTERTAEPPSAAS
jgi:DNA-binding IclR family transcriptional regulator